MTKTFPTRPRGPRYIQPTLSKRGKIGLLRGELSPSFRPWHKSTTELGIEFKREGPVLLPRFREKETTPGEIEKGARVKVRGPLDALRQTEHTKESIKEEFHALANVVRHVGAIHYVIEKQWMGFGKAERDEVMERLATIAGAFGNKKQLRSFFKKSALERIEEAIDLLGKGKVTPALLKLWKSSNDSVARLNQLKRQRSFIQRRGLELVERVEKEKGRLEKYITENYDSVSMLQSKSITKKQAVELMERLLRDYKSLGRKREDELKEAQPRIYRAMKSIERENYRDAVIQMRLANRKIFLALGRQYIMNQDLLNKVSRIKDAAVRKKIFSNQMEILSDNVEYWYEQCMKDVNARQRLRELVTHINLFASTTRPDFPSIFSKFVEAGHAIENGSISLAEEKLSEAVRGDSHDRPTK
mgnify:CR=1 FL=1